MATSGSTYKTFGTNGGYKFILEWKRNSVNVSNNTSNVTVTLYLQSSGSSYTINSSAAKSGSLNINGSATTFTFYAGLSGGQKKQIYTRTVNITHNADGTKSFTMSAAAGIAITFSSGYVSEVDISSCSATLDAIGRTSSFSLNTTSGTIGSTNFVVTINRASTSFTHKVIYKFGGINWVGSTNATTSFSFTPAIGDCSQIPNATSGTGSIVVETYSGSTKIGSASKTITLNVPSSVKPTIGSLSASVVADGAATSFGYVQNKSKCQLKINSPSGSYGSTIKSYKITGNGGTWTTQSTTTGRLTSSGSIKFTATVTDSRGRTSDAKTVTISVQAYSAPSISAFSAARCNSSGTSSSSGTYAKVSATYSYTSLGGKNTVSSKIEYATSGTSSWTNAGAVSSGSSATVGGGAISVANSYQIRLTISDKFNSTSKIVYINPQFVLLNFKEGGKGIGIGKYATTDNRLEIGMRTDINNNIVFNKSSIGLYWQVDTDEALIYFYSTGDAGTSNCLCFETRDNGDEFFRFRHKDTSGSTYQLFDIRQSGLISYRLLRPSANNTYTLGTSSQRWSTVYAVNAFNTSDVQYKENITLVNEGKKNDEASVLSVINNEDIITLNDMRNFIKDDCDIYKYNYIGQKNEEFGFVAQNIVKSKVGSKLIVDSDGGYMYSQGTYVGIVVGALKEEIKIRDKELKEQKEINEELNEKVNKLEERLAKLEKLLNN